MRDVRGAYRTVYLDSCPTEAEKGHSILPFYHSAVLPFCYSAVLPFCRSAILPF